METSPKEYRRKVGLLSSKWLPPPTLPSYYYDDIQSWEEWVRYELPDINFKIETERVDTSPYDFLGFDESEDTDVGRTVKKGKEKNAELREEESTENQATNEGQEYCPSDAVGKGKDRKDREERKEDGDKKTKENHKEKRKNIQGEEEENCEEKREEEHENKRKEDNGEKAHDDSDHEQDEAHEHQRNIVSESDNHEKKIERVWNLLQREVEELISGGQEGNSGDGRRADGQWTSAKVLTTNKGNFDGKDENISTVDKDQATPSKESEVSGSTFVEKKKKKKDSKDREKRKEDNDGKTRIGHEEKRKRNNEKERRCNKRKKLGSEAVKEQNEREREGNHKNRKQDSGKALSNNEKGKKENSEEENKEPAKRNGSHKEKREDSEKAQDDTEYKQAEVHENQRGEKIDEFCNNKVVSENVKGKATIDKDPHKHIELSEKRKRDLTINKPLQVENKSSVNPQTSQETSPTLQRDDKTERRLEEEVCSDGQHKLSGSSVPEGNEIPCNSNKAKVCYINKSKTSKSMNENLPASVPPTCQRKEKDASILNFPSQKKLVSADIPPAVTQSESDKSKMSQPQIPTMPETCQSEVSKNSQTRLILIPTNQLTANQIEASQFPRYLLYKRTITSVPYPPGKDAQPKQKTVTSQSDGDAAPTSQDGYQDIRQGESNVDKKQHYKVISVLKKIPEAPRDIISNTITSGNKEIQLDSFSTELNKGSDHHSKGTQVTPHMPGTDQTPHMSDTNQTPHMPGTDQTPHMPGTNQTPHMPGTDQTPHMPGTDQTLHMSDTNQTPHMPGTDQTPHMPGTNQNSEKEKQLKQEVPLVQQKLASVKTPTQKSIKTTVAQNYPPRPCVVSQISDVASTPMNSQQMPASEKSQKITPPTSNQHKSHSLPLVKELPLQSTTKNKYVCEPRAVPILGRKLSQKLPPKYSLSIFKQYELQKQRLSLQISQKARTPSKTPQSSTLFPKSRETVASDPLTHNDTLTSTVSTQGTSEVRDENYTLLKPKDKHTSSQLAQETKVSGNNVPATSLKPHEMPTSLFNVLVETVASKNVSPTCVESQKTTAAKCLSTAPPVTCPNPPTLFPVSQHTPISSQTTQGTAVPQNVSPTFPLIYSKVSSASGKSASSGVVASTNQTSQQNPAGAPYNLTVTAPISNQSINQNPAVSNKLSYAVTGLSSSIKGELGVTKKSAECIKQTVVCKKFSQTTEKLKEGTMSSGVKRRRKILRPRNSDSQVTLIIKQAAAPSMKQNEAAAPSMKQNEAAVPSMKQNEAAAPSMKQNEAAAPSMKLMKQNEAAAPSMKQNEAAAPIMKQNEAAAPSMKLMKQNEAAVPSMKQNEAAAPSMKQNEAATPSMKRMKQNEAAAPSMKLMKQNEAAAPTMKQNEAAAPTMKQNEAAAPSMKQNEAAAPSMKQNEAAPPSMKQNEAAAPSMKQNEAAAPSMKQNKAATPIVKQNQAAAPNMKQNLAAAPSLKQNQAAAPNMKQNQVAAPNMKQNQAAAPNMKQNQAAAPSMKQNQAAAPSLKQNEAAAPNMKQNPTAQKSVFEQNSSLYTEADLKPPQMTTPNIEPLAAAPGMDQNLTPHMSVTLKNHSSHQEKSPSEPRQRTPQIKQKEATCMNEQNQTLQQKVSEQKQSPQMEKNELSRQQPTPKIVQLAVSCSMNQNLVPEKRVTEQSCSHHQMSPRKEDNDLQVQHENFERFNMYINDWQMFDLKLCNVKLSRLLSCTCGKCFSSNSSLQKHLKSCNGKTLDKDDVKSKLQ
ncbi:hypothetical protein Pcinc_020876 [Petrolisthes cinctipes]|uniref:Uncharacterized protein n=1 Tax=Petrolisthes cinctipes TaxID=88211 RepID=A0AAE1FHA0_PETCI|nr:hypothetical protein Pcinc_020876 [Petrolisthes cinctipes]